MCTHHHSCQHFSTSGAITALRYPKATTSIGDHHFLFILNLVKNTSDGKQTFTMSSKYSGSNTTPSAGNFSSDWATDTADIGTNFPIHVIHGKTTYSTLGLIIRTFAEDLDASINVCPTTTPNYSVKSQLGSINPHVPN